MTTLSRIRSLAEGTEGEITRRDYDAELDSVAQTIQLNILLGLAVAEPAAEETPAKEGFQRIV